MSIADLDDVGPHNIDDLYHIAEPPETADCFVCGQRLDRIAVYWEGGQRCEQRILLHADYAQELALGLVEDGYKARLIEKGRSIYVGVVPSLKPVEIPQHALAGAMRRARRRSSRTAEPSRAARSAEVRQPRTGELA